MLLSYITDTESVMDQKDLLTRCMGNKRFAARILDAFLKQLSGDLDELELAIQNENLSLVAVIAHRVKGSSSNVSARRLHFLATSLGEMAKPADGESLQETCLALREAQQQFVESARLFSASLL